MDPIHPIVPRSPVIGPIAPAPPLRGVDRDRREREGSRRRRPGTRGGQPPGGVDGASGARDGADTPGDGHAHVDISA